MDWLTRMGAPESRPSGIGFSSRGLSNLLTVVLRDSVGIGSDRAGKVQEKEGRSIMTMPDFRSVPISVAERRQLSNLTRRWVYRPDWQCTTNRLV